MDSVSPCNCVTCNCVSSGFQLFTNCFIHISLVAKPVLLSRALDDQMSIFTLTFQCLVNVSPIVMHSPSVIEFKGSPFWDSIFSHINGRVVVLFLYPPEDLPEPKGGHLQPEGTRAQPAAVGHCGHAPVEEDTAQGQSHLPGSSVPRAEMLLMLTSLKKHFSCFDLQLHSVQISRCRWWCDVGSKSLHTTMPFLFFKA